MTATTTPAPTIAKAPGRVPLLGHVIQLLTRPREFFNGLRDSGDVVTIGLGPARAYVVNNPALVHQILTKDVRKLDKGVAYEKSAPFLGDGLLNSSEPTHMAHRRLLQPAFHHHRIADYSRHMREAVAERTARWRDGQTLRLDQEIHGYAVTVVCRALFSSGLGDTVADEVENSLPVLLEGVKRRIAFPVGWLEKLPTPANRRFERARERLGSTLGGVIREYQRVGGEEGDLMALLLAARATDDSPAPDEGTPSGHGHTYRLTDEQIHDEAMALFLGGVETARDVLSWACHLLAEHPDVQAELAAEVDRVLAGGRALGHDVLPELDLTRRVLNEALRLYPPAWLLTRRTLTDLDLAGHHVPPGQNVLFSLYAIQRDPGIYARPDAFEPDRWAGAAGAALPRTSFLPFGAGNRGCIGEPFAWEEMLIFLAAVARDWTLHPVPGHRIRPARSPMLSPRDLPMTVRARKHP
ncbi:cytochrome P450 [Streptomyces sp. NPDC006658]|uniref:cytochrome P450 n=1 Tax=unclassified Streptomyces TaxID=2593676 RepID=UPI0033F713F8